MVEITYQMVLSTLQTAGLLVGIFYYVMTLRNAEKARELTLQSQKHAEETRKIQLLLDINKDIEGLGSGLQYNVIMDMKWDSYDDFVSKYGYENNPDSYRKRMRIWRNMHKNGLLVRDGLIDVRTIFDYTSGGSLYMWRKFKDIIEEIRRLYHLPDYLIGLEYLAGEIEKYRLSQGLET
jgi:hypothetical protein